MCISITVGNGNIFVNVTDPENADYTHYIAEIVAEDGSVLSNNVGQFEKGFKLRIRQGGIS